MRQLRNGDRTGYSSKSVGVVRDDSRELKFKLKSPVEETKDINSRTEESPGSFVLDEMDTEVEEVKFKAQITQSDVDAVKSINDRKSVNELTSEEINKTAGFAQKYYQELGVKSPFFRAWFGDWRANDKTPLHTDCMQTPMACL